MSSWETYAPLKRCSVGGLLGTHDFDLPLEVGGATLLTGANGTGKSTILRAIDSFGRGAWETLTALPFERLTLEFASGEVVVVDNTEKLTIGNGAENWTYEPRAFGSYFWSGAQEHIDAIRVLGEPEINPGRYTTIDPIDVEWIQHAPSITTRYPSRLPARPTPDWLRMIVDRFAVLFITDQRLVVEDRPRGTKDPDTQQPVNTAVSAYAEDLRARIESTLSDYGIRAQALDRAFPNTVLQAMRQAGSVTSRRGAVEALRRVEQVRESLQSAGLVQSDEPPPALEKNLQPGEVAFVRTYADFALQKYEVLDPLLQRVTAFTRFLNARYADKEIRIQRDNGFVVVLDDDEAVLEPSALSSGEQQMLVLAYQIIFLAAPHTLVLIDEPELSLHVSWQSSLVEDLVDMGSASGLSFLLATHSPTLIGARRGERRSLDRRRV